MKNKIIYEFQARSSRCLLVSAALPVLARLRDETKVMILKFDI
jgi:hypothetical protein